MRWRSGACAPRGEPSRSRLGVSHNQPCDEEEAAPLDRQYVGIGFRRRRSVIVRLSAAGEKLSSVRVANDPLAMAGAVAEAGPDPEVVVGATGLKAQVHAVMAKEGVLPTVADMFCGKGNAQLDGMAMADSYTTRVASLRGLIELYDREVTMLEGEIHRQLRHHRGYQAIQAIDGVGRTIAAVLVAEIGDVDRFRSAEALCSWAGLTPKHPESDTKTTRGPITKQGSRLVRWALIEAVSRYHGGPTLAAGFRRIAERRGTNKARVAVARSHAPAFCTDGRMDDGRPQRAIGARPCWTPSASRT